MKPEDSDDVMLPITFMNNMSNVEIEDERTVVHGRGGKGIAVVDMSTVKGNHSFEWKVRMGFVT